MKNYLKKFLVAFMLLASTISLNSKIAKAEEDNRDFRYYGFNSRKLC